MLLGGTGIVPLQADSTNAPASEPALSLEADKSPAYQEALQRGRQLNKLLENYIETLKTKNDPVDFDAIESMKGKIVIIRANLIDRNDPATLQFFRSNVKYVVILDPHLLRWPSETVEVLCLAKVSDIVAAKGIVNLVALDARIEAAD